MFGSGRYAIYVDGSKKKTITSFGVVIVEKEYKNNGEYKIIESSCGIISTDDSVTSCDAEIYSALRGLSIISLREDVKEIEICYDCCAIAIIGDKTKSLRNSPYRDKFLSLLEKYMSNVFVKFTKIKSHSGDKYNDIADSLASKAIEDYLKSNNEDKLIKPKVSINKDSQKETKNNL